MFVKFLVIVLGKVEVIFDIVFVEFLIFNLFDIFFIVFIFVDVV